MNMLPLTKAPRFPNIGLTSTPGAEGTSDVNLSRSPSVGFGTCIAPSLAASAGSAIATSRGVGQDGDAVADHGSGRELEALGVVGIREESLPGAEHDRKQHQAQLVDGADL